MTDVDAGRADDPTAAVAGRHEADDAMGVSLGGRPLPMGKPLLSG